MDIKVDILIPTYKPDDRFVELLKRLKKQTIRANNIIIINTDKDKWRELRTDDKLLEAGITDGFEVHHIEKKDFDHGRARNSCVELSNAKYFICMTQDATPKDDKLIEKLIEPMEDDSDIKMCYARQLPYKNSSPIETYTRLFNYPPKSITKSKEDKKELGIKLYFASNVCCAYDRSTFDRLGHFPENVILNEDMLYARKVIEAGYKIKYCAQAMVFHSHEYSGFKQLKRNFDIAASQAMNPDVFGELKSESEGIRLVKKTAAYLIKNHKKRCIPSLIWISGCKYIGYRLGRRYKNIPAGIRKRLSMNSSFWENKNEGCADYHTGI